jgi:hypothetical protein
MERFAQDPAVTAYLSAMRRIAEATTVDALVSLARELSGLDPSRRDFAETWMLRWSAVAGDEPVPAGLW